MTSQHSPSTTLRNGPTIELTEDGIDAVHHFLIQNGADYKTICEIFPKQTRAMEIAWVITGVRDETQQQSPHPAFVRNLKKKDWKDLRSSLKFLMFDSVRSLYFRRQRQANGSPRRLMPSISPQEAQHS